MSNLRDKILQCDDRTYRSVEVPEWGCVVVVRALTHEQRIKWEKRITKRTPSGNRTIDNLVMPTLILLTCYESVTATTPLFTEDDLPILQTRNSGAMTRLFAVASDISGINVQMEEYAKNSD